MSDVNDRKVHRPGVFSVKLTTVAVVSLCISVSCLASLVVVATITKADALSTVALALAVLAFAAQLIVTIAQAQSSAEQTRDTFRINAETKAVLAELQAQGKALVAVQSSQFEKLLDRAINADTVGTAISNLAQGDEQSGDESPDPEAIALELRTLIEKSIEEQKQPNKSFHVTRQVGRAEGQRTVDEFLSLSPEAQRLLIGLNAREARNVRPILVDGSPNQAATEELRQAGFVEIRGDEGDRPVFVSVRGRAISEFLDPSNPVSWADDLRSRLAEAGVIG